MLSRTLNIIIVIMLIPAILSLMAETGLILYLCISNDIRDNALPCGVAIGTSGFILVYYTIMMYLNIASVCRINRSRKDKKTRITRCCGITTMVMLIPILMFWIILIPFSSDMCIIFCSWITDIPIVYTVYHVIMLGLSIWSVVNIQKEKRANHEYEMLVSHDPVNP